MRTAAEQIGESTAKYLSYHNQLKQQAKIVDAWPSLLPERFNGHCKLASIARGIIRIEVVSGVWMYELSIMKESLLSVIREKFPLAKIKAITLIAMKTTN